MRVKIYRMIIRIKIWILACLFFFSISGTVFCQTPNEIKWETFNGGFFAIEKPAGWNIDIAGNCSLFSFIIHDPQNPIRRVFYFGQVGPFYLNIYQKQIDTQQINGINGYSIPWFDMPVIEPLTAENFFKQFYLISRVPDSQNFIRGVPALYNFQVISRIPQQTPLPNADSQSIRALFTEEHNVGEGIFYAAVAPYVPFDGINAAAGTGLAYLCSGISSYKNDFKEWEAVLSKCLGSLKFAHSYIGQCKQSSDIPWQKISEINKTWSDISSIIQKTWEYQKQQYDITAEKRSDTLRGKERVYDTQTKEVYEINTGDYDKYNAHRENYGNPNLEKLPEDDLELWNKPVKTAIPDHL